MKKINKKFAAVIFSIGLGGSGFSATAAIEPGVCADMNLECCFLPLGQGGCR